MAPRGREKESSMKDGTSSVRKPRWITLLVVCAAIGLGVLAAAAIAQEDTGKSTTAEAQVTAESTTTQELTTEVVPVGGTAAGAGGTAEDGRSVVPILLGIAGLGMALTAAGLARRRRFD
jgi:hypothetical protein